jgi:hypothetical protein
MFAVKTKKFYRVGPGVFFSIIYKVAAGRMKRRPKLLQQTKLLN